MNRSSFDRKRFDSDFSKFDFMSKFILGFIAVVFVLVIVWYLFIGTVAVKTFSYVDEHGMKGAIERVWEGKQSK
jgi:hypothetical protein